MLSNGRIGCFMALLLAGCASGGEFPDAPHLADPQFDSSLALSAATPPRPDFQPAADLLPAQAESPALASPPTMPPGEGPRATSGETRYDSVGYAANTGESVGQGTSIAHGTLPVGAVVELTALDTGRTILAEVAAQMTPGSGRIATMSPAAGAALGATSDVVAVRIRLTAPSPQDRMALHNGGIATRADTPPVLLVALRKRLEPAPQLAAARPSAVMSLPTGATYSPPAARFRPAAAVGSFFVQIAALSDAGRARSLAAQNSGRIVPGGGFYRVQIGPYADQKMAQQARDGIARRGYGDARIVKAN